MTTIDRPSRAMNWAVEMFGDVALDTQERTMRFLEEAIEVAHSMGLGLGAVQKITARVYTREQGEISREIGQAQMTLEMLAKSLRVDPDDEATKEFYRIQAIPKSEWQRRHAAKQAVGTALPNGARGAGS